MWLGFRSRARATFAFNGYAAFDRACGCRTGRGDGPAVAEYADRPPDLTAVEYAGMNVARLRERFLVGPGASHDNNLLTSLTENEIREVLSYVSALSWPPTRPGAH